MPTLIEMPSRVIPAVETHEIDRNVFATRHEDDSMRVTHIEWRRPGTPPAVYITVFCQRDHRLPGFDRPQWTEARVKWASLGGQTEDEAKTFGHALTWASMEADRMNRANRANRLGKQ